MKVAIVTGTSRGLGQLIESNLRDAGYHVFGCSTHGPRAVDVRDRFQVSKFVADVLHEAGGRIDVLVNNAGVIYPSTPLETTMDEDLIDCLQTHVHGPFFMMKQVIPVMKAQKSGVIVNVASKSGVYTTPGLAAYSASKAALIALTQATAKELRETNILCVAVCPAAMNTYLRAKAFGREAAPLSMNPQRVADLVTTIANLRSTHGFEPSMELAGGDCIIVRKDKLEIETMRDDR